MANKCILRVGKIKSLAQARSAFNHTLRSDHVPNADPSRADKNIVIGPREPAAAIDRLVDLIPEKRRKDAVLAIEYLVTASPEALEKMSDDQQWEYFSRAYRWLVAKHGAENVVGGAVHYDETTPHMHVYIAPMVGERLCSKEFIGGPKLLTQMQTDFAKDVGAAHGLERGDERSKATHKRVATWYADKEKRDLKLAAAMETILEIPGAYDQFANVFARMEAENAPAPAPAPKTELEIELDSGSGIEYRV